MGNNASSVIQIYDGSQTTTTQKFLDSLRWDLSAYGQVRTATLSSISRNQILLVLCHNYSRLGTDIDEATSHLKDVNVDYSKTVVVVIHTTAVHALPSLPPTDTLVGDQYSCYGLLVDLFFSPGAGLHRCDLNNRAWCKLEDFLIRFIIGTVASLCMGALYLYNKNSIDTTAIEQPLRDNKSSTNNGGL